MDIKDYTKVKCCLGCKNRSFSAFHDNIWCIKNEDEVYCNNYCDNYED